MSILKFFKDLFQNDEVDFVQEKEADDSIANVVESIVFHKKPIHKDKPLKRLLTQESIVKMHLAVNGSITSWEAINLYKITRLSSLIFILRKKGLDITPIREYNLDNTKHFARYYFKK